MDVVPFGATVLVGGVQLASAVSRDREARMQAAQVPDDAPEAWVYGPAHGDLPRVLLERPQLQRLHVVVLNADLSRGVVAQLAPDPRVTVHPPGTLLEVQGPFAVSPAELRFAEPAALPLRDRLRAVLDQPYREFSASLLEPRFSTHEAENATLGDLGVATLYGWLGFDEVAVVGGGPTASAFFEAVGVAGRPIVAVSTALLPLLRAGVVPDVVVVLDRLPIMAKHFPSPHSDEAVLLDGTTLVYHAAVAPSIPRQWPGPRVVLREGDLEPGGSVVHAAVDLVRRMGARTLHLYGFDCCYPDNASHLAGAARPYNVDPAGKLRTVDGHGQWVPTDEALTLYHRTMEEWIGRHPETHVVKHGRAGVPLAGATWAA